MEFTLLDNPNCNELIKALNELIDKRYKLFVLNGATTIVFYNNKKICHIYYTDEHVKCYPYAVDGCYDVNAGIHIYSVSIRYDDPEYVDKLHKFMKMFEWPRRSNV